MKPTLHISVIIPTYNSACYLPEALESVFAQTYRPLEILVVDDGSTDHTAEILGRYRDRITVLTQPNRGAAAARNLGIRHARGEWLAFLDADDVWLPQMLALQMEALAVDPDADLVFTDWSDANYLANQPRFQAWVQRHRRTPPFSSGRIYRELLSKNCIGGSSSVGVRRACLDVVGAFDETMAMAEDYELWLRICRVSPAVFVNQVLMVHRVHPESLTGALELRLPVNRKAGAGALERHLPFVPHELRPLATQSITSWYRRGGWNYFQLNRFSEARWMFQRCLRRDWTQWGVLPYLAATYLPTRTVERLRALKR